MTHKILQFENETLQQLHEQATLIANQFAPQGPFVGFWWENYLAEVIKASQAESVTAIENLMAGNKLLQEELQAVRGKLDALTTADAAEVRVGDRITIPGVCEDTPVLYVHASTEPTEALANPAPMVPWKA